MVGMILLSLLISAFAFKNKPPLPRAAHTVVAAAVCQLVLSVGYNILMQNTLARRGYQTQGADWTEGAIRWLVTAPLFGILVGVALWWWFKRSWIDDSAGDDD